MKKTPVGVLALLLAAVTAVSLPAAATAKPWWVTGASNEHDFLPPDVAFHVAAHADGHSLRIRWIIADGYYLYRSKFDVQAESPDLQLGAARFPAGTPMQDRYFGTQQVYLQQVEATVPYRQTDGGAHPLQIKVSYQGCALAGLCYPPIMQVLAPDMPVVPVAAPAHPWEGVAIIGGVLAFFVAGLGLRKGRRPAPIGG